MGKPVVPGTKKDKVKKNTRKYKKRKGFCGSRDVVNNVNSDNDVNIDFVNSDTVNNINDDAKNAAPSGMPPTTPRQVNITDIEPTTPPHSISLTNVQQIDYQTPKDNDNISGYRIMDTKILSLMFSMLLCPQCE